MRQVILTQGRPEDLGNLARHMTDLMQRILHSGFCPGSKRPDWTPSIDVCEAGSHYEVIVELAGVRTEDIQVYMEAGRLVICGVRGDPMPGAKVGLLQMEIERGTFRRHVHLPADIDEERVEATFRDGLLRIRVSKRSAADP